MGNIDRAKVFSYLVDSYRTLRSAYLPYSRHVTANFISILY